MSKNKGPILPPGEREREELRALITEAHSAAQELKAATIKAGEMFTRFDQEYEPQLAEKFSALLTEMDSSCRETGEKWAESVDSRMKEFHDRVIGDDREMPPSIKMGIVALVTGVCSRLMETYSRNLADRIVKLCEQRGELFGEEYRKRISALASDISKIVSAQLVLFDAPLINTEVLHILYPEFRVPYEEVAEMRSKMVRDLRGLAHRERTREAPGTPDYEDITLFEGEIRL